MRTVISFILVSLVFFSCNKEESVPLTFSEARYTVTITGRWATPAFTVPGGAHFTNFVGMVHNNNAVLWKDGTSASLGMEALAESGNGIPMLSEIDSMMAAKNAISLIAFIPASVTGSKQINIYCNSKYPLVSFGSMLGPTPDWFVGVSGIDLYRGNSWISDTTVNLYPFDAGTEDGDVLGYNNPESVPRQNIHVLQASGATVLANGNPSLAPIATARFTRQ